MLKKSPNMSLYMFINVMLIKKNMYFWWRLQCNLLCSLNIPNFFVILFPLYVFPSNLALLVFCFRQTSRIVSHQRAFSLLCPLCPLYYIFPNIYSFIENPNSTQAFPCHKTRVFFTSFRSPVENGNLVSKLRQRSSILSLIVQSVVIYYTVPTVFLQVCQNNNSNLSISNSISFDTEHIWLDGGVAMYKANGYLRGEHSKSFWTIFVLVDFAIFLKSLISVVSKDNFNFPKALTALKPLKLKLTLTARNKLVSRLRSCFISRVIVLQVALVGQPSALLLLCSLRMPS